jgi:rod shape-determining protein MreC
MVKRIYDIVRLFKEYFLFGIFVAISLTLIALNDTPQIRSIRSLAVVSVGMLQDLVSGIPGYFRLRRENTLLREINVTLTDEVSRLREARLENLRLHQMLGLKQKAGNRYLGGNVVGKTLQMLRNTITLDVGQDDGVRPQMPIVTEQGLVGKVLFTSSQYSVGQILLNRDLRISAKIQRSRVDGIIQWDGGRGLSLRNVAKTLDVQAGDVVITSDYSSLFPPGIRIGTVVRSSLVPGSLFMTVDVEPTVDFSRVEEVFVVLSTPDSGRIALEQRLRSYTGPQ